MAMPVGQVAPPGTLCADQYATHLGIDIDISIA